jgi:hypothetical protein
MMELRITDRGLAVFGWRFAGLLKKPVEPADLANAVLHAPHDN